VSNAIILIVVRLMRAIAIGKSTQLTENGVYKNHRKNDQRDGYADGIETVSDQLRAVEIRILRTEGFLRSASRGAAARHGPVH